MKVAIISIYNGKVNRGVESWSLQLLRYLLGKNVITRLYQGGNNIPNWIDDNNAVKVFPHNIDDASGDLSFISRLRKRFFIHPVDLKVKEFYKKIIHDLVEFNPDIIIPTNGCNVFFKQLLIKNRLKAKLCIVGHAGAPRDLNAADYYVALSKKDLEYAVDKYGIKSTYITNGIDPNIFNCLNYNDNIVNKYVNYPRPIILSCSALVPYKRIELGVQAVNKLENASYIIIGSGVEHDKISSMIKNQVPENRRNYFNIISNVSLDDMATYYGLCDVFIHPADHSEAFGSVIIEAMSMGKQVIVNDDPIRRDIVGNAGYLVDPLNIDMFTKAIRDAFVNGKKVDEIKKQANTFNWNNIGDSYLRVFNSLFHEQ